MKLTAIVVPIMIILAQSAYSAKLNELIEQNVKNSTKSFEKILDKEKQNKEVLRLWIHVRSESQKKELTAIIDWIKKIRFNGATIDLQPLQMVESGPNVSDLRFFKPQDQKIANALFAELKKGFPSLELKDLSSQYRGIDWITPGHFELWLSPDVRNLKAPK